MSRQLSDREKDKILRLYKTKTVAELAATLHVPIKYVYDFLAEKGLPTFNKYNNRKKKEVNSEFFDWREYGNEIFIG
jgi:hypothetical protein